MTKTPGELCTDCPNRTMILNTCHDVNNMLTPLTSGVALPEEVVYCAKMVANNIQKLRAVGRGGLKEATSEAVTVAEYVRKMELYSEDSYTEWEKVIVTEKISTVADRKIMWGGEADDATIGENLISNLRKAEVTRVHTVIKPFNDTGLVTEIIDNGIGMSRLQIEKINTGVPDGDHGTGCQIIKQLCARVGKTVTWDSIPYVGTRITIRSFFVNGD